MNDSIGEIEKVRKDNPDTHILIMGHSMGGLLATIISIRRPDLIQGVLLSAPFLKVADCEVTDYSCTVMCGAQRHFICQFLVLFGFFYSLFKFRIYYISHTKIPS